MVVFIYLVNWGLIVEDEGIKFEFNLRVCFVVVKIVVLKKNRDWLNI